MILKEYKYILIPIITLIFCQLAKFIYESIREKRIVVDRLFNGSGGMPSSHTALATSIFITIVTNLGLSSPLAGVSLVVVMIVAYDGMNVRMEAGRHAKLINEYQKKYMNEKDIQKLNEELGHKPKEVLVGIILGILIPLCYQLLF